MIRGSSSGKRLPTAVGLPGGDFKLCVLSCDIADHGSPLVPTQYGYCEHVATRATYEHVEPHMRTA